jgi:hypothetical protein
VAVRGGSSSWGTEGKGGRPWRNETKRDSDLAIRYNELTRFLLSLSPIFFPSLNLATHIYLCSLSRPSRHHPDSPKTRSNRPRCQ